MKTFEHIVLNINRLVKCIKGTTVQRTYSSMFADPWTKPRPVIQMYRNIMASLSAYNKSIVDLKCLKQNHEYQSIRSFGAKNFLAMYKNQHYCKDYLYQCSRYFMENAKMMPINDIRYILLKCLIDNQLHRTCLPFYKHIDITCKNKLYDIKDCNEILYLTDIWYCLEQERTEFNKAAVSRLAGIYSTLDKHQFVHFMLLIANMQPFIHSYNKSLCHNLEKQFLKHMTHTSIEETAIITLGLQRNKFELTDYNTLSCLTAKLEGSLSEVTNIYLSDICKLIKISMRSGDIRHVHLLSRLQSHLVTYIKQFDSMAFTHIISMGNNINYVDKGLLLAACVNFRRNHSILREKDVMALLYCLMNYDYLPKEFPNLLEEICSFLRERIKIKHYGPNKHSTRAPYQEHISICVYYLACLQCFRIDLLCEVFKRFINMEKGNMCTSEFVQIYLLNEMVKLEGIQMPEDCQLSEQQIFKYYNNAYIENLKLGVTNRKKLASEFIHLFSQIFGHKKFCQLSFILPFASFESLVFCTDKEGVPVPVPSHYQAVAPDKVNHPVDCELLNWHAIIIARLGGTIAETNKLQGIYLVQKRYMEKCNYKVSYVAKIFLNNKSKNMKLLYISEVIRPFVNQKWYQKLMKRHRLLTPNENDKQRYL